MFSQCECRNSAVRWGIWGKNHSKFPCVSSCRSLCTNHTKVSIMMTTSNVLISFTEIITNYFCPIVHKNQMCNYVMNLLVTEWCLTWLDRVHNIHIKDNLLNNITIWAKFFNKQIPPSLTDKRWCYSLECVLNCIVFKIKFKLFSTF